MNEITAKYKTAAIVSVYNSEKFIKGCLEDLTSQTLFIKGELQIVIVNSGSRQNEDAIISEYDKKHEAIVYIRTEERETIYKAWNRAIEASDALYITNANTDDRHRPDALERMTEILDNDSAIDLVYADSLKTTVENDTWLSDTKKERMGWIDFDKDLILFGCFIGPHPMWRKSLHEKFGLFDDSLKVVGDYEFWLRISRGAKLFHLKEPLGLYLYSSESAEHRDNSQTFRENDAVQKKYLARFIKDREYLDALMKKLKMVYQQLKNDDYYGSAMRLLHGRLYGLELESKVQQIRNDFHEKHAVITPGMVDTIAENIRKGTLIINREEMMEELKRLREEIRGKSSARLDERENEKQSNSEVKESINKNNMGIEMEADKELILELSKSALEYYENQDWDNALEKFNHLETELKKENNSNEDEEISLADIVEISGFAYLGKGDLENATVKFEEALNLNPQSSNACAGLGEVLYKTGMYNEAGEMYKYAIKFDSGNMAAKEGLAKIAERTETVTGENQMTNQLHEIQKLIEKENFQEAEALLLPLMEKLPENIDVLNMYSIILSLTERYEEAAKTIMKVLDQESSNIIALENLKILEKIVDNELINTQILRAEEYLKENNFEEARKLLETVLEKEKENLDALNDLAVIHVQEGRLEEALRIISSVLDKDPKNEVALENFKYVEELVNELQKNIKG